MLSINFDEVVLEGDSMWVRVKGASIYIKKTDEGVAVDIYPRDSEESLASCYVFDSELSALDGDGDAAALQEALSRVPKGELAKIIEMGMRRREALRKWDSRRKAT
jgi:hypothetical protein